MSDRNVDSTGRRTAGTLFVVATPIGNLQDLSPRAAACLRDADLLLAEDTRHTRQLLEACGISRSGALESLHEHNERQRVPALLARLQHGESVALVTDAGTPLMSDPGATLVSAAADAGLAVVAVPGACAAIAALSIAGLPTDRFAFEGFLPAKTGARREVLQRLSSEPRTLVFYEAPHRLVDTLRDLADVFGGERKGVVARELTKRFESTYRGTLADLAQRSSADADMTRGELVILVTGAPPASDDADASREAERVLRALLAELPVSQAARLAAELTGRSRSELYERALALKGEGGSG
ncbi:MAG TPA: 16S rRNA (cytidine(1402)-2'-O)-methyltransferase [Steroidobacteraceae bacterium]|nr:16S rRNA (cytidine(1402)-2'-O)-methyltransferase [Steroidobacteraceae bacterium]